MGWGGGSSEVNCVILKRGGVDHFRGVIPPFGVSVTNDPPPFCSSKNQVIPPKSSAPSPPQAINNDRSLMFK